VMLVGLGFQRERSRGPGERRMLSRLRRAFSFSPLGSRKKRNSHVAGNLKDTPKLCPLTNRIFACFVVHSQPEASRRDALANAAAAGAAFIPVAANAAAGESPRFSVFGLLGDGTAYSEGAAYGSDQSTPLYSPYSVYGEAGKGTAYKSDNPEYDQRKKDVLAESKKRLGKLDAYIQKKKWYEVKNELGRYMYETRGAVRGLAKTTQQKAAATDFFEAIEKTQLQATLKRQDACEAAAKDSIDKLDAFVKTL